MISRWSTNAPVIRRDNYVKLRRFNRDQGN